MVTLHRQEHIFHDFFSIIPDIPWSLSIFRPLLGFSRVAVLHTTFIYYLLCSSKVKLNHNIHVSTFCNVGMGRATGSYKVSGVWWGDFWRYAYEQQSAEYSQEQQLTLILKHRNIQYTLIQRYHISRHTLERWQASEGKVGSVKNSKQLNLYSALYKLLISKVLRYGQRVTRGSHSFTCHQHMNHTCLYSPAGITAPWPVLIVPTHEGMARLSVRNRQTTHQMVVQINAGPSPVEAGQVGISKIRL